MTVVVPPCPTTAATVPGRVGVLACPPALCPFVEFGAARVLNTPVSLIWRQQPALPGQLAATLEWLAPSGSAGPLAAELRRLEAVRFEIVEGPAQGADAERYAFTPELGLHRAGLAANGDVMIGEEQLRRLLADAARTGPATLPAALERLLGSAWDEALEPLRRAGDGAPVTWLPRTG